MFSRRELERYKDILLFCHILIICLISLNFLKIFYYKCIFIFFDKSQKNRQMFHEKSYIFRAICIIVRVLILQFLIATLNGYVRSFSSMDVHKVSDLTLRRKITMWHPRFTLYDWSYHLGSHLIPNSDCTPSGYHERDVHREDTASTSNPLRSGTNQLRSSRFEQISSWPPRIA